MARFFLTDDAKRDVSGIVAYIRRENRDAAKRVRGELRAAMQMLANLPGMGHTREDLTPEPVRFWSVYSYLIVYKPDSKPLQVLRVLRGARDVGAVLRSGR
jgi:plasmid stabilization system protein ParE